MKRLPDKQETINAFLTIVFVVNFWAVIVYLNNFPGLIKQLSFSNLLAVLSYVIFLALLESLFIFLVLIILSVLLPPKLLRANFSGRVAIIILLSVIYIIPFHFNIPPLSYLHFEVGVSLFIGLWTLLYISELVIFIFVINKYPHITNKITNFVERIAVVGAIYLFFDLAAASYVIVAHWS